MTDKITQVRIGKKLIGLRGLEEAFEEVRSPGCRQFYQQVVEILAARSLAAELQYITDPALLRDYGIRTFPALIINGRVTVAGKVPPAAELEKILTAAASR